MQMTKTQDKYSKFVSQDVQILKPQIFKIILTDLPKQIANNNIITQKSQYKEIAIIKYYTLDLYKCLTHFVGRYYMFQQLTIYAKTVKSTQKEK